VIPPLSVEARAVEEIAGCLGLIRPAGNTWRNVSSLTYRCQNAWPGIQPMFWNPLSAPQVFSRRNLCDDERESPKILESLISQWPQSRKQARLAVGHFIQTAASQGIKRCVIIPRPRFWAQPSAAFCVQQRHWLTPNITRVYGPFCRAHQHKPVARGRVLVALNGRLRASEYSLG